jgi:hypothetical protein
MSRDAQSNKQSLLDKNNSSSKKSILDNKPEWQDSPSLHLHFISKTSHFCKIESRTVQ